MYAINVAPQDVFKAASDPTRIRILRLLAVTNEEACLCELVDSLQESESNVSRHLKILRQSGLLSAVREGRWIYHRLVREPSSLRHMRNMLRSLPDIKNQFKTDLKKFRRRAKLREGGRCKVGLRSQQPAMDSRSWRRREATVTKR
jgi:ArsR family transcriptional regulator, arsenate/arsenite/antimonite-responsive transcriptional repressor